jgi:predicted acyltransferase
MIVSLDLVLLFVFYHPPPRSNSQGLSKREVLARIDFVGGLLSIGGIALFLLGLQWGGYTMYTPALPSDRRPWQSASVIVTITLGGILIILFVLWENRTPYPMVPGILFRNKVNKTFFPFLTC